MRSSMLSVRTEIQCLRNCGLRDLGCPHCLLDVLAADVVALPWCVRFSNHGVVGELGSHSLDNEIDKGIRSIQKEFSVGIAPNFRLHATRLRPSRQAFKLSARRLAQE